VIEQDGDETIYATGGVVRPEPFLERDIRVAVERLRRESREPVLFPAAPNSPLARAGYAGLIFDPGDLGTRVADLFEVPKTTTPTELEAAFGPGGRFDSFGSLRRPKTYSPLRRWLRAERAREHQEAIAADVETVMGWRPSRAPAVEIASRAWRLPPWRSGPLMPPPPTDAPGS